MKLKGNYDLMEFLNSFVVSYFFQVRSSGSPLSPFLYAATAGGSGSGVPGDPMSSPPPAHMGTYFDKSSIGK